MIVGRMFRIVALILVQLLVPSLAVVSDVSVPYAYADSDSDSDSDGDSDSDDGEDSDDSDDSDDSNSESETGSPSGENTSGGSNDSGNTENESKDADDADNEGARINKPNSSLRNDGSARSHQRSIRKAVQQKQILPLGKIKRYIEKKTKSEIIYIELEREYGRWVYEFKIVDRRGRLREIYVDATNGKILKSEPIGKRGR